METTVYIIGKKAGKRFSEISSDYQNIAFALKARGFDVRYALSMLHIENGKGVCTNGHILFAVPLEGEYENGDYRAISVHGEIILIKETGVIFPAWQQTILDKTKDGLIKFDLIRHHDEGMFLTQMVGELYKHSVKVSINFLRLLVDKDKYTIYCEPPKEDHHFPVLIEQGGRQIVMMPFRAQF